MQEPEGNAGAMQERSGSKGALQGCCGSEREVQEQASDVGARVMQEQENISLLFSFSVAGQPNKQTDKYLLTSFRSKRYLFR